MDWDSAKKHCKERNWQWTLDFIDQARQEMESLEDKIKKLEANYQKLNEKHIR